MAVVFQTTRFVEFADTDMAGIVHFAQFFRYMESAEHAFLRSRGLSVNLAWEGEHFGFPRVSASCEYLRPARCEDVLDVEMRLVRLGKSSLAYETDFSLQGQAIARGKVVAVCCRAVPGKGMASVEIPASLRARLLGESGA